MKVGNIFLFGVIILALCARGAWAEELLTWEDCLKEAQKNHPDLISAQANVDEQKAGQAITASGMFPQISADMDVTTTKAQAGSHGTDRNYSYGVTGTQLLFNGFKKGNDRSAATENVKVAQQQYRFTSADVRFRLRAAFISLVKAQESIKVAQEIAKIRKDNFDLINLRYASGLEHRGALLTAGADLTAAESEQSQARRAAELAQRQLTKEMGREKFVPFAAQGVLGAVDPPGDKPDYENLIKNHPSVRQLVAQENAAAFGVKSAYGNFFPELSARAGAGRTSSRWPPENDDWNAGLAVSLPLFEGGLKAGQVAQAKAAWRQVRANARSTRDSVAVALEQTWLSLQNAVDRVAVQGKNLAAAEERARIAEAQFSTGFITYDNWTIIQDNVVSAKKTYLEAQANALTAEADWVRAKGETLEYAQQ